MKILNIKNNLLYIINITNEKKSYLKKGLAKGLVKAGEGKSWALVVGKEVSEYGYFHDKLIEYRPVVVDIGYVNERIDRWRAFIAAAENLIQKGDMK